MARFFAVCCSAFDRVDAADARTDSNADTVGIARVGFQTGILDRLRGRGDPQLDEIIDSSSFFGIHIGRNIEIPHTACNLHGKI